MTGAERLVRGLEEGGVEVVFGLPGVHNLAAWEALRASERIRLVSVRHEQTAGYAADGYARATGKVGVALVTTGPGATNCVTPLGEAYASGSPVLLIATQVPTTFDHVPQGVLHGMHEQWSAFSGVTKGQIDAQDGQDLGALVGEALRGAAQAPRQPVYLGIAHDLLSGDREPVDDEPVFEPTVPRPDAAALDEAARLVAASRRPLVWAGGGARGDGDAVGALAAKLGAPLVTTFGAAGLHPSAIAPPHEPAVGALWDAADLVIGIGSDFDGVDTQNWQMPRPPKLLALSVWELETHAGWQPDVHVAGEAAVSVPLLSELVERRPPWFQRPEVVVEDEQARQLIAALDAALPPDAAVVCDMCIPGYWVGGYRPTEGLQYPIGWGTLGFGFPAALGASLSRRATVAICGDGGFLFACGELAAAEQERLPITVLLFDDGGYGMLRHDGGDPFALHTPDFVALAQAFGVYAEAVTLEDLGERLALHVDDPAPSMIVVRAAMTPPPTTSPKWYRSQR